MRNVLVAGIGSTTFGRHTEVDIQVLAARAADAAIKDSGLSRDAVGALARRYASHMNACEFAAQLRAQRVSRRQYAAFLSMM